MRSHRRKNLPHFPVIQNDPRPTSEYTALGTAYV
jgi:hypothetical protein